MLTNQQAAVVNPAPRRKPRKIYTKSQWETLISEYEVGQFNQKAFCHQHNISVSSFHKWSSFSDCVGSPSACPLITGIFISIIKSNKIYAFIGMIALDAIPHDGCGAALLVRFNTALLWLRA